MRSIISRTEPFRCRQNDPSNDRSPKTFPTAHCSFVVSSSSSRSSSVVIVEIVVFGKRSHVQRLVTRTLRTLGRITYGQTCMHHRLCMDQLGKNVFWWCIADASLLGKHVRGIARVRLTRNHSSNDSHRMDHELYRRMDESVRTPVMQYLRLLR